jgi:membrane fusion protein (multidrug efflux system)
MNKLSTYIVYAGILFIAACTGQALNPVAPPPSLPVIKINSGNATTWLEYPTSVEGTTNVEIRPQVSGYLEKIYVEEGAYVAKGQPYLKSTAGNTASYPIMRLRPYRKPVRP